MEQQHKDKLTDFKNSLIQQRAELMAIHTAEKSALAAIPADALTPEQRRMKNDQLMVFCDIFDCMADMVDDIEFLISLHE